MNKYMARLLLASSVILLVSGYAEAVGCNEDEIEVYRDKYKIVCKDRAKYAACIKDAGEKLKLDIEQSCGKTFKDCFEQQSITISRDAAGCLALALFGCGAGKAACAEVCNVLFTSAEWVAYHSCSADITSCYESALARDKERKELCKQ